MIGLQKTSSADNYITDSGAAGNALAVGNKTRNGAIGMDPQGNRLKQYWKLQRNMVLQLVLFLHLQLLMQHQCHLLRAGLTAPVHNPYSLKGRGDMLTLSSGKPIEILSKSKKGFF